MRIIAGKHKGKKLKSFQGDSIRPTADRAKEALFNILSTSITDCDFLDLCAGTGAIGLEAYSRGAKSVTFVDSSLESMKIIKFNALSVGLSGDFVLDNAVNFLMKTNKKFDLIFYDPPYADNDIAKVLNVIKQRSLLTQGGRLIYERPSDKDKVEVLGFNLFDSRKYGIAVFDFYKDEL